MMSVWKYRGDMRFGGRVLLVCNPPESLQAPGVICGVHKLLYEHKTLESEEHTLKPCARCSNCSTFNLWSLFLKKNKTAPRAWFYTHTINTASSMFLCVCPLISATAKIPQTVHKHPGPLHTGSRKNTQRNVAISPVCNSVWFRWERGEEDAWGKVAELGSVRGQGLI